MNAQPPDHPQETSTPPAHRRTEPPLEPRKFGRRGTLIGSVIAIAVVAGIGWLAWDLTQNPSQGGAAGAASGARGGASGARAGGPGGPGGPGGGGRGPATTVGVAVAEKADIPVVIDALGTVVPQTTVKVRPQVSGVLQQIVYKEGTMVKKGELLATIDPRQFEMNLQQAVGQRMKDEAQLEAARVTLQRFRTLLQQDSIARQEVDTQAALVKQLEATLVVNKANEGTARLNLSYTRIVAPVAGRLGLRTVDIGNVVGPNDANGVAVITQLSPIDVEFAIPQDQAPSLNQNAGAFMEAKAFDRSRLQVLDTGVFASLDNQIDTQTGTVRAKARFNNTKGLLFPSQFVNVQLNVRTIKDAVMVPVSAVRRGNNGEHVFVLNPDRTVTQRAVVRGQATVDKVQIASGLQAGERVITEGADRLRDGSRVMLPGDSPGQGGRRRGPTDGASAPASGIAGGMAGGGSGGWQGGAQNGGAAGGQAAPQAAPGGAPQAAPGGAPQAAPGGAPQAAPGGAPQAAPGAAAQAPAGGEGGGQRRRIAPEGGAPGGGAPAAAAGPASDKPTPEQRQRMLDSAQGDPEQLERRKRFLEALDRGDPQAVERWKMMQQRRREQQGQ